MEEKRFFISWKMFVFLAIIFIIASWFVCSSLSPSGAKIEKNTNNLSMGEWLLERGIVVNSDSPKVEKAYKFLIIHDRELVKSSPDDALWISHQGGGDNLYFLCTDTPPSVR